MGYNILVNSIQMVRAYAIFANGGLEVQPHLVRKIIKAGKVLVDNTQYRAHKRVLSPEIARTIARALKYSTKEGGTSKRADIPGYTEAGKSGTSEKIVDGNYSKTNNISSFVGFAPAQNAKFVLLVSIDEPEAKFIPGVGKQQMGGVCAAPVFREIALKSLEYLGVAPDDRERLDWKQEVADLKMLYEQWTGS
jgi:cell division protein FtsI (penicillin-binding protein 3)